VTLAVWRFLAVRFPIKSREWCSPRGTRYAIVTAYIGSSIICIPLYLSFSISSPTNAAKDETLYYVSINITIFSSLSKNYKFTFILVYYYNEYLNYYFSLGIGNKSIDKISSANLN